MPDTDLIDECLTQVTSSSNLTMAATDALFTSIMNGTCPEHVTERILIALHQKGETADEIAGAARAIRRRAITLPCPVPAIDVCGTGGDGQHSFNISTAVALVVAACGVPVAKHGNRAASSRSGTADVLEYLGVRIDCSPETSLRAIEQIGLCFLMAPYYHPGLAALAPVRKRIRTRTIFNLLGPMLNPVALTWQLTGVFAAAWLEPMARALGQNGVRKLWTVHGDPGIDELSLTGPSHIVRWHDHQLVHQTMTPEEYGLDRVEMAALQGGDVATNAAALKDLLGGQKGAYRDIVLFNSAAALVIADRVPDVPEGLDLAARMIDQGAAHQVLHHLITMTQAENHVG